MGLTASLKEEIYSTLVNVVAGAFECIQVPLTEAAGLGEIDAIGELRFGHAREEISAGVDVLNGRITDMASGY